MQLTLQKRMAGSVMGCSPKRVWFDEENLEQIKEAITKVDIKSLIKKGIIAEKPEKGVSRGRARALQKKKSKGQRKGLGSRKGKKTARTKKKETWMNKIRSQREIIKKLKLSNQIKPSDYRKLYSKTKSGFFRNKRHLKLYIEEHKLINKENKKIIPIKIFQKKILKKPAKPTNKNTKTKKEKSVAKKSATKIENKTSTKKVDKK